MGVPEHQRAEFHNANEAGKVEDLCIWVPTIQYPREIEKFCALVYLRPESLFQRLFRVTEGGGFFNEIEVSEDADHFGKAMRL